VRERGVRWWRGWSSWRGNIDGSGWRGTSFRPERLCFWFKLKTEFRPIDAALHYVAGFDYCRAHDPVTIQVSAVATVEIGDDELRRIGGVLCELEMLATHHYIRISKLDIGRRITPDDQFLVLAERKLLNLTRL